MLTTEIRDIDPGIILSYSLIGYDDECEDSDYWEYPDSSHTDDD